MAQLKNTNISDTGFLQLPVGTTAQRPAPAAGQMRFNSTTGKAEFYNATAAAAAWLGTAGAGVVATSGTVYDTDVEGTTYRVHVFTATGNSTFTVSKGGEVEYLIVAGGGAGGSRHAGGGGAGGLLTGTTTVTPQNYAISVGAGGAAVNGGARGSQGENSSAFGLTAIGGGGGGGYNDGAPTVNGGTGGSGGGGASAVGLPGGTGSGGAETSEQGNAGGNGPFGGDWAGAGGGGAGATGKNPPSASQGGVGGQGISFNINGATTFYAGGGGGGGGSDVDLNGGAGGFGGGGRGTGSYASTGINAVSGTPNTGGGGGGARDSQFGGAGGSGVVIVRYPLRQENPVAAAGKTAGDGVVLDLDFAKPTVYSGSGTTVSDSRLNGITGTLVNGPVFTDPRTHRSSIEFVGTQHASISNVTIPSPTGFSCTVWFNQISATDDWQYVLHHSTATAVGSSRFFVALDPANVIVMTLGAANSPSGGGGTSYNAGRTSITAALNTWYNTTLTWNGSAAIVYVNGVQNQTYTVSIPSDLTVAMSMGGTVYNTGYRVFDGRIGTFSLYDRALTATEVAQQYNATRWRFGV